MIKSAGEINEAKQNFLSSLSYAEKLSEQLSEQSKKCTEIEEKIKQILESKINYKDDEEYLKLENRKKDLNVKMDDIKRMRAANFRCRQKRINAAKVTKSNVAEQRNNSSKSYLFIKFIKFLFFLPVFYLVYMIIRSFFHIFDDLSLVLFNDIFIVVMLIIYFIVYYFISVILDDVNERIMRKRKVNVTTEPFKVSDVDTTDYDERIDKFNLQIVSLGEELQKCKNDLQSYLNEKEKVNDEILQKENERFDETKRERDKIKSNLDSSIFGPKYEQYRKKVNFTKKGKLCENGNFSRFYQLIEHINPTDIDTLLFVYNKFAGRKRDQLKFESIKRKKEFITENESEFYKNVLLKVVEDKRFEMIVEYQILCSIRLIDFFNIDESTVKAEEKYYLMNKHIDFALLNLNTFHIDLLIELDDDSHFSEDALTRDFYKDLVITKKGYTLYRTDRGVLYEDNIKGIIHVLTDSEYQGQIIYNYSADYQENRDAKLHEYVIGQNECVMNA